MHALSHLCCGRGLPPLVDLAAVLAGAGVVGAVGELGLAQRRGRVAPEAALGLGDLAAVLAGARFVLAVVKLGLAQRLGRVAPEAPLDLGDLAAVAAGARVVSAVGELGLAVGLGGVAPEAGLDGGGEAQGHGGGGESETHICLLWGEGWRFMRGFVVWWKAGCEKRATAGLLCDGWVEELSGLERGA